MRLVHPGRDGNSAFKAACAFDNLKLDLAAVRSTAILLSTSEGLEEDAQDAFRGIGSALDSIICNASAKSDEFMRAHRGEDARQ